MQDVDIGKFSRAIGFRKTTTSIRKGCISGWVLDDEKLYAVCTVKKGVFPYQPPFLIKGDFFNKFWNLISTESVDGSVPEGTIGRKEV